MANVGEVVKFKNGSREVDALVVKLVGDEKGGVVVFAAEGDGNNVVQQNAVERDGVLEVA